MTPALESELTPQFGPGPWARREATLPCAPKKADERLARVKEAVERNAVGDLKPSDIDPLSNLPTCLQGQVKDWGRDFALYGAANAWLLFVGPSPGTYTAKGGLHDLVTSTPTHRYPTLGWPHPSFFYSNTDPFIVRLRAWARETLAGVGSFVTEEDALSCTLLLNLTHGWLGNAKDVDPQEMAAGARRFWVSVVPVARPRLVIALTRDVYQQLRGSPPSSALREPMDEVVFRDPSQTFRLPRSTIRHPDWSYPVLLATVPTHPSREQLRLNRCGKKADLDRYLRETARVACGLT